MKIVLNVERGSLRRWHEALAERLARRPGVEIGFRLAPEGGRLRAADALFRFETVLFGLARGASERLAPDALDRFGFSGEADIAIDLARHAYVGDRVWRVECDGAGLEDGLLAAALAARPPWVRVIGPDGVLAQGRPGSEYAGITKLCFEDTLARVATLIEAALDGASPAVPLAEALPVFDAATLAPGRWFKRAARMASIRGKRAIYEALCHTPHWRVGWRRERGLAKDGLGDGWVDLPDDAQRFYADPFPIVWRGATYLFVEEFAHKLGKGVISAVEFGADGPKGKPEIVLEHAGHLSYPNVFERDGEMWMIPESCAAGTIDLYRARAFPGGWTHEATLVADVVAGDATLVERDGRWWMLATVRDGGGAYSDALWLWSAPDFRGAWTAHAHNPVLIDIASARPAGRMFERDGALYRVVQDCRDGYGAAMGLARVDRLDDSGFAQTVETIYRPGGSWPGRRVHTYNVAGGFEFIDGSALAPRWPALRAPLERALGR